MPPSPNEDGHSLFPMLTQGILSPSPTLAAVLIETYYPAGPSVPDKRDLYLDPRCGRGTRSHSERLPHGDLATLSGLLEVSAWTNNEAMTGPARSRLQLRA
ncbi:hypothetical protein V496_08080 [Pseudogymnoascus sp. VKM F-4515 (FW-2607)]|nr:hypothetical protein V496_08080 [Pseudogymnoascus sp. VKM F-4515 (FW-2607)]